MLTLIGKVDYTSNIPFESIKIDTVAGDPVGKATFQLIDPGAQITLQSLQEVIFLDETVALTLSGGSLVTSVPAHNYLANNNFNFGSGGYTVSGSGLTFPASGTYGAGALATLTYNNTAIGTTTAFQNALKVYSVPSQQYCFSGNLNITQAFVNSNFYIQIAFLDGTGAQLAASQQTYTAATGGVTRISLTATAPAGTITVQASFGGHTTSATNAGTATFTALQLEPVWFPSLYTYPTPICDFLQSDSVTFPDATAARFDRIFTGNITHYTITYDGTTRIYDVEVTSLDGWLENVTLVNNTYNGATDQSIITGIVNSLPSLPIFAATPSLRTGTPQALAYRNVPIVYAGITVSNLQFADATLREVMDALADMTGFLFGIDPYYNVFYYPPFYNAAPYGFSSSPDGVSTFGYYDYSIEYDASQIQNALRVAGSTISVQTTEAWNLQDGSHSETVQSGKTVNVTLFKHPNAVPSNVTIAGTGISVGEDTGIGYGSSQSICAFQFALLSFPAPGYAAGTAISVTYTYSVFVYVLAQSPDSIGQYGRPLYSKINDTNLISNAAAATAGEAQLQAYAQPRVTVKFKTQKLLYPGQVIEFTSAQDNLTKAHYTVQKVTASYLGNGLNQYEVECGTYVDDFVDFFRNTQKAVNRATHDPADPIQQFNNLQQDAASYTDSLNIHL